MKELKVFLSPFYFEEEFEEEVSGILFKKAGEHSISSISVHSIDIEENKLSGIQSALRKNILLPYDKQTLEFVNGNNIAEDEEPVKPEEPVMEAAAVKPVKRTRKSTKKETE
ncbi:hypothetical protein P9X07_08910 [Bacillus thuringiensis]|uniref:hypothetical protein n=1 Tax=Bacillus paranthracis TaxID=2026186 RepID=UPI002DC79A7C|nr:hypothetical protein [Bacillus thuringiensis]